MVVLTITNDIDLTITNDIELEYANKVLEAFASHGHSNPITDQLIDAVSEYELLGTVDLGDTIKKVRDQHSLIRILSDDKPNLSLDHIIELADQMVKSDAFKKIGGAA